MNRRSMFTNVFGQNTSPQVPATAYALPVAGGLTPYNGIWDFATASHLLRRACFGASYAQINQAVTDGLLKTMTNLLAAKDLSKVPLPSPPVNPVYANDPDVPIGSTWVSAPSGVGDNLIQQYRQNSVRAWSFELMFSEQLSLREKMTLFWHNHFVTADTPDPRLEYKYLNTLRENALGNFKTLTKSMTIDPAMLLYLNGNQNTSRAPNENYARELLELFTIGKGELAGPGDYTTFTEVDVAAIAKCLTGWKIPNLRNATNLNAVFPTPPVTGLNPDHDYSDKTLSHRFNNFIVKTPLTNNKKDGIKEYEYLIDEVIFNIKKADAAKFLATKLYRYFVYYKIDSSIESEIIDGLAQRLIADNFEVSGAISLLLSSEHFYSDAAFGAVVQSPLEFIYHNIKSIGFSPPTTLSEKYAYFLDMWRNGLNFQQGYLEHPSVAGWSAYYQEPSFHEIWISSATLPLRMTLTQNYVNKTTRVRNVTGSLGFDLVAYIQKFQEPSDVNKLINSVVQHLLPRPIQQNQIDSLKEALLQGNPDYEWKVEYDAYIARPSNTTRMVIDTRLKRLFNLLLAMPENYLI